MWAEWRYRQRIEQYQDNIVAMGHSGYLPVARRAGVYVLRQFGIDPTPAEMDELMEAWQQLKPFDDVIPALQRLKTRYKLVALSNGERTYLDHLVEEPDRLGVRRRDLRRGRRRVQAAPRRLPPGGRR